jgi:hypothetical protein
MDAFANGSSLASIWKKKLNNGSHGSCANIHMYARSASARAHTHTPVPTLGTGVSIASGSGNVAQSLRVLRPPVSKAYTQYASSN